MRLIAPLLFSVFCCVGCATIGIPTNDPKENETVESLLDNPAFQQENQPIRHLEIAVLIEESRDESVIRAAIADASALLERQVGVVLDVLLVQKREWRAKSFGGVHRDVRVFHREHPEYDIVIGIILDEDFLEECIGDSCVKGKAYEWQNIVLRSLSPKIIAHEVGHTLLPWKLFHSSRGLMMSSDGTDYFSVSDRERILREKWRNYRKKPTWYEILLFSF